MPLSVVTTEMSQIPAVGVMLEYSISTESSCGYGGKIENVIPKLFPA